MLTNDFHTDKKKCTQEAPCLPWPTVHRRPLSLLHGIKLNLSLVELVCDYKWARGVTLHSQSGWKGTERRRRNTGGKRATVMSHAGWVNNQSPACSRWCLVEYKQSGLLMPQQGKLLHRQKKVEMRERESEVDRAA